MWKLREANSLSPVGRVNIAPSDYSCSNVWSCDGRRSWFILRSDDWFNIIKSEKNQCGPRENWHQPMKPRSKKKKESKVTEINTFQMHILKKEKKYYSYFEKKG